MKKPFKKTFRHMHDASVWLSNPSLSEVYDESDNLATDVVTIIPTGNKDNCGFREVEITITFVENTPVNCHE